MVNDSLERLIVKNKVDRSVAEELRRRLAAVSSVDEGTFEHFYGLVAKGKVKSSVGAAPVKKKAVKRGLSNSLLNYDDAIKYVAGKVIDLDATQVLTWLEPIERGEDFFYRISDIDSYLKKVRVDKLGKYRRSVERREAIRVEKELFEGRYK